MSNNNFLNGLKSIAGNVASGAKSVQKSVKAATANSSGADNKPMTKQDLVYSGWTAAIFLCVILCVISVIFASCAKPKTDTDEPTPPGNSAAPNSNAPTSPALHFGGAEYSVLL